MARTRSTWWITIGVAAGLLVLLLVGWQLALRQFQAAVLASLGPRASVAEWSVGIGGIELRDVRIRADRTGKEAWPAEDELRAARLWLVPQWRSVWASGGAEWRLSRVRAEGLYLSVWRPRQGPLRWLPSLRDKADRDRRGAWMAPLLLAAASGAGPMAGRPPAGSGESTRTVLIDEVQLSDAAVDFHDASVGRPAHRLQLAGLQARLGPMVWPALDRSVPVSLRGLLKGQPGGRDSRDGEVRIDGELTPATRDATLAVRLRGVDLRVLQPYLLRLNEGGIERGLVDLDLDATVKAQRLRAPGRVVFTGLELAARPGLLGSFAGLPQQLVLTAVREQGRIELKFTLEGRLDDPAFSLNENLLTRLSVGLAQALGVSVGGVVEGLGSVIKGLFGR